MNLTETADSAPKFGFEEMGEAHFPREELNAKQTGLSYQVLRPGKRQMFGHRHEKAEEVVTALFEHWINDPEELPVGHFEEVENEGLARVVADYIAGMTDSFILLQYAQIKRALRR